MTFFQFLKFLLELPDRVGKIETNQGKTDKKVKDIMSELDNVEGLISQIDAETNRIADKLNALQNQISTEMSADDVAKVKADLQASVDRLKGVGADPNNPVPPNPDVPPPAPLTPTV